MKNSKQAKIQVGNKYKIVNEQDKTLFEYETEIRKRRKISVRSPKWLNRLVRGIRRTS